MGLISRVSSRTYREKSLFSSMRSRLLNFAFRRSSEQAEQKSAKGLFKKAYENPLPLNVRGELYRHADRYGLKTYSLKELSETGPDFLRGIAWTAISIFLVWTFFMMFLATTRFIQIQQINSFTFFKTIWTCLVILKVLWEVKPLKRRKCCMVDTCFMEADSHKIQCSMLANRMEVYKRKILSTQFFVVLI